MSKVKVITSDGLERIAGTDNCTTLAFTLVSGSDRNEPEMWVETFLREEGELKERRHWDFPKLKNNQQVTIVIDPLGEPDSPDRMDKRAGQLLTDPRLVVEEGIQHAKNMNKILRTALEMGREERICSFCARPQDKVAALVGGPIVHICNHCLDICNEVIKDVG